MIEFIEDQETVGLGRLMRATYLQIVIRLGCWMPATWHQDNCLILVM
jgi:hypothetical protein